MPSHFFYWKNCKGGPKKGALVFADGTHQEFDMNDPASFEAARVRLSDSIGEVYLVPADGSYSGEGQTANRYIRGKSAPTLAEAIANLREALDTENAYQKRMTEDPAFALEERIKRHDWTYWAADDHASWSAGNRNAEEIRRLIPLVPNAKEIWERVAPAGYDFPGGGTMVGYRGGAYN